MPIWRHFILNLNISAILNEFFVFQKKNPQPTFPPEILEIVFFLCDNFLQLTLVCPSFNEIISDSPSLMDRLTLDWDRLTSEWDARNSRISTLLESDRKYGRLVLYLKDLVHFPRLMCFIEKHKRTLKHSKLLEKWL